MDYVFFTITIAVIALTVGLVGVITYCKEKPYDGRTQQKQTPKTDDTVAEMTKPTREQAPNTAKRFSTKKKVAIVMFALQILGNAGAYMEGGLDVASALARGIGASVFLIVGMVLILTDEAR